MAQQSGQSASEQLFTLLQQQQEQALVLTPLREKVLAALRSRLNRGFKATPLFVVAAEVGVTPRLLRQQLKTLEKLRRSAS